MRNSPKVPEHDTDRGMIGFGTEFALTPNWSAKTEYDWIGFGNANLTLSDGTVVNTKSSISEAKIGLNYRFNSEATSREVLKRGSL